MKKYTYSNSTNTIWTSFDYGDVEANSLEEAREKAEEKLKTDLTRANILLKGIFTIDMDFKDLEVREIPFVDKFVSFDGTNQLNVK